MKAAVLVLLVACGGGKSGPDANLMTIEACTGPTQQGAMCAAACNEPAAQPTVGHGTGAAHCYISVQGSTTDCLPDFLLYGVRSCCWPAQNDGVIRPVPCS